MRWAAGLAMIAATSPAAAQVRAIALVRPDRDFGYFVGDVLTAGAVITTGPDTVLDRRTLPSPGPVSAAIDVRDATVSDERTADGHRYRIRVTYQTFFSPEQVSQTDVPAYTLTFTQGHGRISAVVPGFAFTSSVFRHDLQAVVDPALVRPDHAPILEDAAGPRSVGLAGIALVLAGLLALRPRAFWRALLARQRLPFAAAARSIRQICRAGRAVGLRETLVILHRAFDETAGQRVLTDDLDQFVTRHASFAPLREDIRAFFAISRNAFFGNDQTLPQPGYVLALCRALARAERS